MATKPMGGGKVAHLIRTQKVGDHVSQGRVFNLGRYPAIEGILAAMKREHGEMEGIRRAMDMSFDELLGVIKYEVPCEDQSKTYGPPPAFFRQPGAPRVQDAPYLFESRMDTFFQISEKLDGIPISVYYVRHDSRFAKFLPAQDEPAISCLPSSSTNGKAQQSAAVGTGRLGVCTRRDDLHPAGGSLAWQVIKRLGIPDILRREDKSLVIQGELCGSTILSNSLGYWQDEPHDFFAFQIWDIEAQKFMPETDTEAMLSRWSIPQVPVLGCCKLRDIARDTQELLLKADGMSALPGREGRAREGILLKNFRADAVFKVISNEWLLYNS